MVVDYVASYRRYCWPVNSIQDLRIAPFHLLASEAKVHVDRDHQWHMQTLSRLSEIAANGATIMATRHQIIDVTDPQSEAQGVQWWSELTGAGGEGMVVKPLDFAVRGA